MDVLETELQRKAGNTTTWAIFAALCLATIALFFIPAYIIQPFKFQSARGLVVAMALKQQSPWLTLVLCTGALFAALELWRRVSFWKKSLLVLGLCLATAATAMARVDYFEWMFHPVASPGFAAIEQTKLDSSEMLIAVRFANDARAYPIREMAYHHIVNDVVGGVPIAVTY